MGFKAQFKSASTGNTFPLDEVVYRDEVDGSLLEVDHDLAALKQKSSSQWKELFQSRKASVHLPTSSGVWGKKEWVLPQIPDESIVSLGEGWSSLLPAAGFGKELGLNKLWIKLCGNSHTGSFKDLGMTVLVSQVNHMRKTGVPIKAVACASTGDTSAALAAYCAAANIPSIVFLPQGKISPAQLVQPICNGSIVVSLKTDFDGCMKVVQEVTQDKSLYLANSMNSLRLEGQKTISIEICQQLGWDAPDVVIIPGGNLGNVSALGMGFEMLLELGVISQRPKLVVAQSANANPLYQSYRRGFDRLVPIKAKKTLASAIQIGNPVSYNRAVNCLKSYSGEVLEVSEQELADASHQADRAGFYSCPHTGVALGALIQLVNRGDLEKDQKVVVVSTAHGLKFSEFKSGYHSGSLKGIDSKYGNPIEECEANSDAVWRVLERRFKSFEA